VSAAGIAAGTSAAVSTASENEVVAALQALGYSLGEAREASRLALQDPAVGAGLEDRVKAALRTLLRD
jgi:Holliday junction resolvasome RuvABC DNA-binding subunit